jgi:hypothetical protein
MSRRLDFNRDFRNHQTRHGVSVKDEAEWMKNDAAACWLRRNENRTSHKAHRRPSTQAFASSEVKVCPRKRRKERHADLDPRDPHDQPAGVDLRQIPWI